MIRKAPSPVPFEGGLECRPEDRAAPAALIVPVGRGDREQSAGGECDCHEGIPQESATLGNDAKARGGSDLYGRSHDAFPSSIQPERAHL